MDAWIRTTDADLLSLLSALRFYPCSSLPSTSSFIVFRASDVKDLKIEQDAPPPPPPPQQVPQDPAIMSVSVASALDCRAHRISVSADAVA